MVKAVINGLLAFINKIPDLQINFLSKGIPYTIAYILFWLKEPEIAPVVLPWFSVILVIDLLFLSLLSPKADYGSRTVGFVIVHLRFLTDFVYTGLIIYYTGGINSEFILLYPVIMIRIMLSSSRPGYFFADGFLGHIYYIITLWLYYGSLDFYFTKHFWTNCIMIGISAWVSMLTVNRIANINALRNKLGQMANQDELTRLYNHRYFYQRLEAELEAARNQGHMVGLLFIDIDHFKIYNDKLGHLQGDQFLKDFAALLKSLVRADDIACRYGGDEFVLILPNANAAVVNEVRQRIENAVVKHPFSYREVFPEKFARASIGMAVYPDDGLTHDELVQVADADMYQRKNKQKQLLEQKSS